MGGFFPPKFSEEGNPFEVRKRSLDRFSHYLKSVTMSGDEGEGSV